MPNTLANWGQLMRARLGTWRAAWGLWVLLLWLSGAAALVLWLTAQARAPVDAEVRANAQAVAAAVAARLQRANELGLPPEGLVGLDAVLRAELDAAPELRRLQVSGPTGAVAVQPPGAGSGGGAAAGPGLATNLSSVTHAVLLTGTDGTQTWQVEAAYPAGYVASQLRRLLIDLLVASLVVLVLVRELAQSQWAKSRLHQMLEADWKYRLAPMDPLQTVITPGAALARSARTDWLPVRLGVFFVALSEEMLRPFFAVFAVETGTSALPSTWLAALPLAVFMLCLAVSQPLGPALTGRLALRRLWVGAALAGAACLVATVWVQGTWALIGLRAANGLAYGLLLILGQTALLRMASSSRRARALVEIAQAIVAAGIVGPVLGAALADRFGLASGFWACAACLLAAAALGIGWPTAVDAPGRTEGQAATLSGVARVLRMPQLMGVVMGSAMPARLLAAMLLVLVVPLYLSEQGAAATVTGRVLLLYFLAFMLCAPLVATWSDRLGQRKPFVLWACGLSAVACVLLPWLGGVWGAAAAVALLGVSQAVQSAPQLSLATEVAERASPGASPAVRAAKREEALAAFRFMERLGSIAAPLLAAAVAGSLGLIAAAWAAAACAALGLVWVAWSLRSWVETGPRTASPDDTQAFQAGAPR